MMDVKAQAIPFVHRSGYVTEKALQRKDGVWDDKKKAEFMVSALNGKAFSSICVVNVRECLQYSHEVMNELDKSADGKHRHGTVDRPKLRKSIKTFERLLGEGKEVIIIEGGNRNSAVHLFMTDGLQLPKGTIIRDALDGSWIIKLDRPMTYSELTSSEIFPELGPDIRGYIRGTPLLNVLMITKSHWYELEEAFVNINDGIPLVAMEKLWVETTGHSEKIRSIVSAYSELLDELYCDNKVLLPTRRGDAKAIVQAAMIFENPKTDTKMPQVKAYWRKDDDLPRKTENHIKAFATNLVNVDLDRNWSISHGNSKKTTPKKWISSSAFAVLGQLTKEGHEINEKTGYKYASAIIDATEHVHKKSKEDYTKAYAKASDEGSGLPIPIENDYAYWQMSNSERASDRNSFMSKLMPKVRANLAKAGLSLKQQRTALQE